MTIHIMVMSTLLQSHCYTSFPMFNACIYSNQFTLSFDSPQFSMLREVVFQSENSGQQLLPFTQPIRVDYQDHHFMDTCFY